MKNKAAELMQMKLLSETWKVQACTTHDVVHRLPRNCSLAVCRTTLTCWSRKCNLRTKSTRELCMTSHIAARIQLRHASKQTRSVQSLRVMVPPMHKDRNISHQDAGALFRTHLA